ncbi:Auxin-responsive protein SAUR71 [Linum grandiflorum]
MEPKKGNLIIKTWEKSCKLLLLRKRPSRTASFYTDVDEDPKRRRHGKRQVAPEGCFTVYVGAERQRFVVRTEYANHPMFRVLLDEAESEFGYNPEGPLVLPCRVDCFWKVLVDMDSKEEEEEEKEEVIRPKSCGRFAKAHGANYYQRHVICPSPLVALNRYV